VAFVRTHHTGFTVVDLERTVAFYRDVVGLRLLARKRRRADDLGTALMGPGGAGPLPAEILIADMAAGESRVEFIQYVEPRSAPYAGNPSVAGSTHLALLTDDIEGERARLERAGVLFHTPIRTVEDTGKTPWRWCYFRDPDGICVELVQGGEPVQDGDQA
jgi:glyoxylase I family protein